MRRGLVALLLLLMGVSPAHALITATSACPLPPVSFPTGETCWRTDNQTFSVWTGSAWNLIAVSSGSGVTFTSLTLSGLTAGSVLFAGTGGLISQDNSQFFYDATNHRLGIGAAPTTTRLEVWSPTQATGPDLKVDTTNGAASVTVGRASATASDSTNFFVRDRLGNAVFFVSHASGVVALQDGANLMNLGLNTQVFGANAGSVLGFGKDAAPTTSVANVVQVWGDNVKGGAGTVGLRVRDELGAILDFSNRTLSFSMGSGTGFAQAIGNASAQTGSVCTVANTTETDLFTFSLPAASLDVNGKWIDLFSAGTTGANATTKRLRLYMGATVVADTNATLTGATAGSFELKARIIRTGATAQAASGKGFIDLAATSLGLATTVLFSTPAETLSGAVTVKVTGQNGTANANDICAKMFTVEFANN